MKKKHIAGLLALLLVTNLITAALSIQIATGSAKEMAQTRVLERFLKKYYLRSDEITEKDFIEGRKKGTVAALKDPYSQYFDEEEYNQFMESTTGEFFGVGVQIGAVEDSKLITVIAPIKGSPAEAAGLKSGDKIVSVDGVEYTVDEMEEAVKHIKGDKGTTVTLGIMSGEEGRVRDVKITRDEIHTESVITGTIGDIAYIGLTQFEENTAEDFTKALKAASDKKGLILDLRGNPGGILEAAVAISDQLLPKADIVSAKDNRKKEVFHYTSDEESWNKSIVVLVNGGSASASEIVAGALKDNKAATLVGEKTYGKGVVQTLVPLPGGGGIKLTTSEYFTPSGVSIQDKGIEPDVKVSLPEDVKAIGLEHRDQDTQLQKAIAIIEKSGR